MADTERAIERLFTDGLLRGYAAGALEKTKSFKGEVFPVTVVHLKTDSGVYHDEWTFGKRTGVGQELTSTLEGEKAGRAYAGGVVSSHLLDLLPITEDEVLEYHRVKIVELGEQTRLKKPCKPKADGHWQYEYEILFQDETVSLRVGRETISFKEHTVFVHYFLILPIE